MTGPAPARRRGDAALLLGVAAVALLPFVRTILRGDALYFRDLARHFFPLRLFALDGLRQGELRYWNPLLHGGIPVPFPPIWNPVELLALVRPGEAALSLLLVLHVPLAAAAMAWLARELGAGRTGAAAAGLVYALGGFALSTLNLYIYVQTMAWAPLAIGLLRRAAASPAAVVPASLACGLLVNTAGVELVAQALLAGVLLSDARTRAAAGRIAASMALGVALAAPTLLVMAGVAAQSERAAGFSTDVALAHSIHPFTFLQVLVSDLYGDTGRLTDLWWGANFFPRGFPYFLSLYVGAPAVALALAGALGAPPLRNRLLVLALLGIVVGLGRWGVIEPLVDAVPALRALRNPSKAFFSLHLAASVLAGWGVHHLSSGERSALRRAAAALAATGSLLLLTLLLPAALPGPTRWFVEHFFPPPMPWPARGAALGHMIGSAVAGGALAVLCALLALAARSGRLPAGRASVLVVMVVAADLLRAGAGLNPTVRAGFFAPSAEARAQVLPHLRGAGRVFTCEAMASGSYWAARAQRPLDHETWTFAAYIDTLTPDANMRDGIPTALSEDMTSLVPVSATLPPGISCGRPDLLLPRLREAHVTRVVSLDALDHPDLRLLAVSEPARIAPLRVHVYEVVPGAPAEGPQIEVLERRAGEIELRVQAPAAQEAVVPEGWARGWSAEVGGRPVPVRAVDGDIAVAVPAGTSAVRLRYTPPGLAAGVTLAAVAAVVVALLWWRRP